MREAATDPDAGGMSLPHTMRASLEVRPVRVLALEGGGEGAVCLCMCVTNVDTPIAGDTPRSRMASEVLSLGPERHL